MKRKILSVLIAFFLCATVVWAQEEEPDPAAEENYQSQLEVSGAGELAEQAPEETQRLLSQLGLGEMDYRQILSLTPSQLWQLLKGEVSAMVRAPLRLFGSLLAVVLLCAVADALKAGFPSEGLDKVFGAVAVLCLVTAVLGPVRQCMEKAARAIGEAAQFMNGFIPVFCGILTAGGQPVTAGVYHLLLFGVSQVVSQAVAGVLVPLIGIFLAFSFVSSIAPSLHLDALAKTIKKIVSWALGLLLTVYVGLLGVQSLVAAGADTVTVKTAKFVTSSFVPVIGSALSDAMATAQACLKLLRSSVGVYGVLVSVLTFLPVFLEIACWYLAMTGAALAGQLAGAETVSKLLESTASALGLLVSITLLFGLLFIISTTILLIVGTGG